MPTLRTLSFTHPCAMGAGGYGIERRNSAYSPRKNDQASRIARRLGDLLATTIELFG
jgi:hypothetical protein